MIVTDSAGCQATDMDFFEIFVNPVGLDEYKRKVESTIFPNPITDRAIIKVSKTKSQNLTMEFYDTFGREVKQLQINNVETEILRSDFEIGVYFYRLFDNNKLVGQGKLITL